MFSHFEKACTSDTVVSFHVFILGVSVFTWIGNVVTSVCEMTTLYF